MIYQRKQGPSVQTVVLVVGMVMVAGLIGCAIGLGVLPTYR